jgi:DNA polymerase I-like protein with 3'-5' exonuclease and polymerase domains
MIEYDVETDGLQWPYHNAFLYQFEAPDGSNEAIVVGERGWKEQVQTWFDRAQDDPDGIRAWNSKFDLHFGLNHGFKLPDESKWHDGMIVAHAIDERRSMALKSVANEVLGEGSDDLQKQVKAWLSGERRLRAKAAKEAGTELIEPNYADVPHNLMIPYGLEDVSLTRRIGEVYDPIIASTPDLKGVVDFEREVLAALFAVERRGFPADELGYRMLLHEVTENIERLEEEAEKLAAQGIEDPTAIEYEFNPKSSKQIYEALKRQGADLRFVTNESMDAENLATVEHPLAQAILRFRSEYKAMSTYIEPMISRSYETGIRAWKMPYISPDGRVHANYRQVGARTGRMSCSDPNMQNQPRDDLRLRYNFRAEPGHKLVACDLSNVEMRIFAFYAGQGEILNAVREGKDLHKMTAEFIGIRDRKRPGGEVESARQRAKTFNFSIVYGGGIRTIRKQQRVSQDEARLMLRRYHDAYPEVRRLQNRIEWALYDRGYVAAKATSGRRYRCADPGKQAYKYMNYLVQGTAADVLKAALVKLHKQGVPVVALIHDEIVAHVSEKDAKEVKHLIEEAMTDHPAIIEKVPLEAEGEIIDRWSEAKDPAFVPKWAQS